MTSAPKEGGGFKFLLQKNLKPIFVFYNLQKKIPFKNIKQTQFIIMATHNLSYKWLFYLIMIPLSIWLLFTGFKNEKDPYWTELDGLLTKKYTTLDNSTDSITALYADFHGTQPLSDSVVLDLIRKPFMPTMEWAKLQEFFNIFKEKHSSIFSAVTGSGNTTLVDRIANLIASKPENKLVILCAPQFDMEYNKKYIGHFEGENFVKGVLLKFWDKCKQNPKEKFVCMIDNIDKINPETFFGPEIWQKLDDPKMKVLMGKDTITMPTNFYLLSITQSGVGQKIELTNEHLRRLGGMLLLPIHPNELILFLRGKKKEVLEELGKKRQENPQTDALKKDIAKLETQFAALNDTLQMKSMVYFFKKTNEMIVEHYSHGHQIGQWSDIRKNFTPADFGNIKKIFINHVNAYRPDKELKNADFADIEYAIKNDGSIPNTSPIWKTTGRLTDLGFASELGVAGTFALISGIFGWFYYRKRHIYIKDYTQQIYDLMERFEQRTLNYDEIVAEVNKLKREFDTLVLDQKVNYNEAAFFYGFLEDKTRFIEIARETNESFLKLMDAFLEDRVLTITEYNKLNQFLEGIRHRISTLQYMSYKDEIERVYQQFGQQKENKL